MGAAIPTHSGNGCGNHNAHQCGSNEFMHVLFFRLHRRRLFLTPSQLQEEMRGACTGTTPTKLEVVQALYQETADFTANILKRTPQDAADLQILPHLLKAVAGDRPVSFGRYLGRFGAGPLSSWHELPQERNEGWELTLTSPPYWAGACSTERLSQRGNVPGPFVAEVGHKIAQGLGILAAQVQVTSIGSSGAHEEQAHAAGESAPVKVAFTVRGLTLRQRGGILRDNDVTCRLFVEFDTFSSLRVSATALALHFDLDRFGAEGGASFTACQSWEVGPPGSERLYHEPTGWLRYGLSVLGAYEDDTWLHPFQHGNNWHRGFLRFGHPRVPGGAVAVSPAAPSSGDDYAGEASVATGGGLRRFRFVLQVAMRPGSVMSECPTNDGKNQIWTTQVGDVRPYGLLIKERSCNGEEEGDVVDRGVVAGVKEEENEEDADGPEEPEFWSDEEDEEEEEEGESVDQEVLAVAKEEESDEDADGAEEPEISVAEEGPSLLEALSSEKFAEVLLQRMGHTRLGLSSVDKLEEEMKCACTHATPTKLDVVQALYRETAEFTSQLLERTSRDPSDDAIVPHVLKALAGERPVSFGRYGGRFGVGPLSSLFVLPQRPNSVWELTLTSPPQWSNADSTESLVQNEVMKKDFAEGAKQRIAQSLGIAAAQVRIIEVRKGSVKVDFTVDGLTEKQREEILREDSSGRLRKHFDTFRELRISPVVLALHFDLDQLDAKGDKMFSEGENFNIGPPGEQEIYHQPQGWTRYGFKVLGKFADDTWLHPFQHKNNWYRAFHGTKRSGKLAAEAARKIVADGFRESVDGMLGPGVYVTPWIDYVVANKYVPSLELKTNAGPKMFQYILQVAVRPGGIMRRDFKWRGEDAEWTAAANDVRVYGLLIKEETPPPAKPQAQSSCGIM